LRRAQMAAEAARPYAERIDNVLANLAGSIADPRQAPPLLAGNGKDQVHLLVVCTGERGLCGAFNTSIARLAREHALALIGAGKTVKILCVGRKGYDVLKRQLEQNIIDLIDFRSVRTLGFGNADQVGQKIRKLYADGEFDVCTLFYSTFKSVIQQIPTAKRLIPAEVPAPAPGDQMIAYEYEPDETAILADLLPRNISVQVLRALLENNASFYGSQMSAMDNATRNAGEMIKKQTITYNRTRQAMITKELIEIISGAEAL
jgi:F-type H+-transporting ATPase subunit gamma